MKHTFNFFVQLCLNNNREWFDQNRSEYKSAKSEVEGLLQDLIKGIGEWDNSVENESAKDALFRIFRDTRFSPDKTPYKTHFGGYIVPGGRKRNRAGYYIHIEPDNSFLAGGIYSPPSPELLKIRTSIYNNPELYLEIVNNPQFMKHFEMLETDKLKTAPRGFPKDWKYVDIIRNKHFAMSHKISDEMIVSDDFIPYCLNIFKAMQPMNSFINSVVG